MSVVKKKVVITSPWPTVESTRKALGLSKAQAAELDKWVSDYLAKKAKKAKGKKKGK